MNLEPGNDATVTKYLAFAISKERYCVNIRTVQEIIGVAHITPVPRCPGYVKGVINLRGRIIPVFDLRLKFGIQPIPYDAKTCIIVVQLQLGQQRIAVGVIVDTVLEVVQYTKDDIAAAPTYSAAIDSRFITGMGKKDDELTIVIDIQKVITEDETGALARIGAAQ